MKHSEECPLTGKLFETILASTDLPEGVFNEVYGDGADTGEYLMNSAIDLVWFTGSTGVGKHLYLAAAKKFIPALLELGGSAPGIVCADADPESAVKSIYFNRFLNSGQTCDGLKRLIVHKSLVEEVTDRLKALVQTKKIGPAEDPATDIGPLAAERQLTSLEEQVADALAKGAKVIMGAQRPKHVRGAYYEPTILTDITQDMKVWKEEVFGPVLPIVSFDSLDQAIALANDTIYGLGAYVYSRDNDQALHIARAIKTGNVSINNASYVIPENPFGGVKDSGLGREHGRDGLRELCSVKTVAMKK
jgi:succinate-semialdehyde dehydrogenase/glutarate-semialdehyde dehydrogenase